ncbi:MAG TPA: NDP-sugar synthase [Solirubrobacterales bacterium]|jgi:mannose-1-phosphate guanylyltransferase/mannose-1-phosphate guanylyltransferase/phosphomannomutase|nr:NDP-sugar synthase [Solirubrobacterales bacterium]HMU25767.1 NDP-sugar synthase [Solirubrobacterales bacterium]HMX70680.1 NDP-sugar synthase [Solirubrobacterales bacterium]HMY26096.1 NDP-sugar synthase [Solirubrobacterales bacterium]HNA23533.1 NDP-sugar synthase [Solirubrobacterales bacterium]
MKAMVLAAGLGTRLRPVTRAVPKPMVPVLNRPVMEHIIRLLARHGFTEVIANIHWYPDVIRDHFGDGSGFGIELSYSFEEELLGTAGGVRNASAFFDDDFLVISGDAMTDIDLSAMREFHRSHGGMATLATRRVDDTSEFGVVITDDEGRIQGFQEKPDPDEALSDLANCGIYMFNREIFDYFPGPGESKLMAPGHPDDFADWAYDVFPAMLDAGIAFYAHETDAYWNDIGTIEELVQSNFDGLFGDVDLGLPEKQPLPEVWVAGEVEGLDGAEIDGPVLIGDGARIGEGAQLVGPLVLGEGCSIGAGAGVREAVLLSRSSLEKGAFLAGGLLGPTRD